MKSDFVIKKVVRKATVRINNRDNVNVDELQITAILEYHFKTMATMMTNGEVIPIPKIGTFKPNENVLRLLNGFTDYFAQNRNNESVEE